VGFGGSGGGNSIDFCLEQVELNRFESKEIASRWILWLSSYWHTFHSPEKVLNSGLGCSRQIGRGFGVSKTCNCG